jgi:formate hydrogenlyase transcriptional activator
VGDISLLAAHFLRIFAQRQGKSIDHVPHQVMTAMERYSWPGNIRELQNFMERSVILSRGSELRAPLVELPSHAVPSTGVRTLADADRAHIQATLRDTNWRVGGRNGAAAKLGVKRTTLISRMQKLGIWRETVEQGNELADANSDASPSRYLIPA